MIRFALHCDAAHEFEGWFRNNADFDDQRGRDLIACPVCGSQEVEKALMAPAIAARSHALPEKADAMVKLHAFVQHVKSNAEDVGSAFPEEARKIHFGEAPVRGIYGEAKPEEARALIEDGVGIMPLPSLPQDKN